jgi:hypothetical protein
MIQQTVVFLLLVPLIFSSSIHEHNKRRKLEHEHLKQHHGNESCCSPFYPEFSYSTAFARPERVRRSFLVPMEEYLAHFNPASPSCGKVTLEIDCESKSNTSSGDSKFPVLPRDPDFIPDQYESDYLALAIKLRDQEAICFSKQVVEIEGASQFLQSVIMDLITQKDTELIEALGRAFPTIFTAINSFHEPYAHLSATSYIRIAVDMKHYESAVAMTKNLPLAMIGDFWGTLTCMRDFILYAMSTASIRLIPLAGESALPKRILVDMLDACVAENNLEALEYLYRSTGISLKEMLTSDKNISVTTMYMATSLEYPQIVTFLGKHCPELYTIPSSTGMLPIHCAAFSGNLDILKLLSIAKATITAEVIIGGIKHTPFSLAIRHGKRNVADAILAFIEDADKIQMELRNIALWAIVDDNEALLDIYFNYNPFPEAGCIEGKFNLLEMAIRGSISPQNASLEELTDPTSHSSIKCLERLIRVWKDHRFPFSTEHDEFNGSLLALVLPHDMDAFATLIRVAGLDPNEFIYEKRPNGTKFCTTFLNRIIAQGATNLVPQAIKFGADPRIVDDNGDSAYEVAIKSNNEFVKSLLLLSK